tara:strand:+ start:637 stop:813 length:177 start_codon:yes stop_codon:yes gene_type:complete
MIKILDCTLRDGGYVNNWKFLDMGYKVKMRETQVDSIAVDTPEDVKKVEQFLKTKGLV